MHEFQSLKILGLFKSIFTKLGIDFEMMKKIIQIKLVMDERRVPTIFSGSKKKEGNQFLKSLWVYGLYGLILIPFILLGDNYLFQMSIVFGIVMFILLTSMISDFTAVLLDVRDKNILHTKPVTAKTIGAAKIFHVMIYMTFVAGAFTLIPLVISLFRHGFVFAFIFLMSLVFTLLFIVVLTAFIYLFVLRFFDGERLKDIVNYVQILLSVGTVIGYQILIRTFELVDLDIVYSFEWWHYAFPPLWYGASFEVLLQREFSYMMIGFVALAVIIPLLSIFVYSRLMPSFERNLEKLLSDTRKRKKKWRGIDDFWAVITCRSKEERVFFRFAALMMKQEREFKLKVYPGLGIALVFPFIFIVNELSHRTLADISMGKSFLLIYFCNLIIPGIVLMLKYSGNYKGGWLFKAAPIMQVSSAYSGTLKAFLVKMYLPVFLVLSLAFTFIFTARILPDLVAILLAGIVQILITYRISNNEDYPFSNSFDFAQSEGTAKTLLLGLFTLIFVVAHFLAGLVSYGVYFYIAILLVGIVLGWRFVFPIKVYRKGVA